MLAYAAANLPDGASVGEHSGIFAWQPSAEQLGPVYIPITVTDDGSPGLSASSLLTFEVLPPDPCLNLSCESATGCSGSLQSVDQPCCAPTPAARVAEANAGCPGGRILFVGRNAISGFGRLQDCDRFRVINFGQIGAAVRFHVQARCLNTDGVLQLHAHMETTQRVVIDGQQAIALQPQADGFAQRLGISLPVRGPGPFFDYEAADANLDVTVTDSDGISAAAHLRLVLTFSPLDDLLDLPAPPLP